MTIPASEAATGSSGAAAARAWRPPRDAWIAGAGIGLIYAGHWLYGAVVADVTLVLNILAALLVGAILLIPRLRDEILRLRGLAAPAALFGLTILVALWTLTPWVPGGPHPVWSYLGVSPGASTIDKSATTVEIVKLLGLGCVFILGLSAGARDERAAFALQLAILLGVAFGLWAFVAAVADPLSHSPRLTARFVSANVAGTLFAALLVLALADFERKVRTRGGRPDRSTALVSAAAALALAMCLVDTASRGALVSLALALVVFVGLLVWLGRLKPTRALLGSVLGALALFLIVAVTGGLLIDRTLGGYDVVVSRTGLWAIHWPVFLESPLLGYGLGSWDTLNKITLTDQNFHTLWAPGGAHSVYLQWLEDAGLLGAIPMFACVGLLASDTLRRALRRSRMTGLLAGLVAADAVFAVHGASDISLQTPTVAAFWAWLLGLQFSLAQGSSRR